MELKTLWLGLVLSLAAFAVKTGLGWAYLWQAGSGRHRLAAAFGIATLYAAVFAAVALLVSKINLLAHYEILLPLWRHGVVLHWLTALMLCLWGLILLRRSGDIGHTSSRGWLALVIPCPVCLSVILMSTATLVIYFPEKAALAVAALFGAFMGIAAVVGGLAMITRPKAGLLRRSAPRNDGEEEGMATGGVATAENNLGLAMLMVAAYFMLSALITPQFSELGRVYRISAYAASARETQQLGPRLFTVGAIGLLFLAGFLAAKKPRGGKK